MVKKKKKASTELARRPKPRPSMRLEITAPKSVMPELLPPEPVSGVLGDEASVGQLGLVEVKLTDAEEAICAEAVNPAHVLVKPTGQPYLPHQHYTRWFNRAFGRLGWAIVPKAKPVKGVIKVKNDGTERSAVLVPYLLYVHTMPVAFAWGEQEYSDGNAEQTYGDAAEATVASALRRCAKRLGIGLELWDKEWLQDWLDKNTIVVKVGGYDRWRRPNDPPLRGEASGRKTRDEAPAQETKRTPPPAGTDNTQNEVISQPQRQRLATIARKAGRNDAEVAMWLKKKWKVASSKEILRKDYDKVCSELEAKGDLHMPGDGEV